MSSFIHTIHTYILILARYLAIFAVIGFMPVPLFSFLGGDSLAQIDPNPLFDYFKDNPPSTDAIIENVFTNVYIVQNEMNVEKWDLDNAVFWADAMAYRLGEEGVPVIRHVFSGGKDTHIKSLKAAYVQDFGGLSFLPENLQSLLLSLKARFELLLPTGPVTEDARQWIILALDSSEKNIKRQLKSLTSQFPNDNFLVLTQTPVSLNKKTLQFCLFNFNVKKAKQVLSEGIQITEAQAEILLIENDRSLWSLNNQKGEARELSFKSLLRQNYRTLGNLSQKNDIVLTKLCKEGKVKVNGKKAYLAEYGVIIKNKNYQWRNEKARINYQLQKETLCGKAWIDVDVLAAPEDNQKFRQQQQKEEQANESEQEDKFQETTIENRHNLSQKKQQIKTKSKSQEKKQTKVKKDKSPQQRQQQIDEDQSERIEGLQHKPQQHTQWLTDQIKY